jgi:hypothetical protein
MWRSLAAAALVYGFGHPGLDGYRPAMLDRPLQAFHQEVNVFARDGKRALGTLDDARSMRYLGGYIEFLQARMRGD